MAPRIDDGKFICAEPAPAQMMREDLQAIHPPGESRTLQPRESILGCYASAHRTTASPGPPCLPLPGWAIPLGPLPSLATPTPTLSSRTAHARQSPAPVAMDHILFTCRTRYCRLFGSGRARTPSLGPIGPRDPSQTRHQKRPTACAKNKHDKIASKIKEGGWNCGCGSSFHHKHELVSDQRD